MKILRTRKKRLPRSGFTLLELLIVLAIIVSLAAMVAPNLIGSQQDAKIDKTSADIRNIETAVKVKSIKKGGTYDAGGSEVIDMLSESYEHNGKQQKPVMEDFRNQDEWGNPFQYSFDSGSDTKPRIWSFGPNGQDDNGEGDDISNILNKDN